MARLFVAVEPPESLRERGRAVARRLRGARAVRPEQVHLTLRFIGELGDADAERALEEGLAALRFPSFEIVAGGLGAFPSPSRPRVAWIGVEPSAPLRALHAAVEEVAVAAGAEPDDRPFRPHLTIARFRGAPTAAARAALRDESVEPQPFVVREVVLFESELSPEGATHRVRRRVASTPPAG